MRRKERAMRTTLRIIALFIIIMMIGTTGVLASSTPSKGGGDLIVGGVTPPPIPGRTPAPGDDISDPFGIRGTWVPPLQIRDWAGGLLNDLYKEWIKDWLLFIIDYAKMNKEPPWVITQEYLNILAFLRESGKPIIEYFSDELQNNRVHDPSIRSFYPKDFDMLVLVMYEYWPLGDWGYERSIGDVRATWQFPTEYKVGQLISVVIGIMPFGNPDPPIAYPRIQPVEWYPLRAEVIEYGNSMAVQVYFTIEVLELLLKYPVDPACIVILSEPFEALN